ncbi:MAG: heterodisulfide reductase-related iron-sulfur binding cluster, partial [bacterium]
NITHPEMSRTLLEEKMASISRTGAEAVVAPNPGCMLQIQYGAQHRGNGIAVYHLMDLLDRAYQAAESPSPRRPTS